MPSEPFTEELPLPKAWKQSIKSAVICTLSLAFKTITLTLGHLSDSDHLPVRMTAQLKRLKMDNAQLKEIIEIKDARMIRLDPKRRPYYSPTERMRILELKSITGMSNKQAAETFLVRGLRQRYRYAATGSLRNVAISRRSGFESGSGASM